MYKATMTLLVMEDLMQQPEGARKAAAEATVLVEEAAPKVEFVENCVESGGLIGLDTLSI